MIVGISGRQPYDSSLSGTTCRSLVNATHGLNPRHLLSGESHSDSRSHDPAWAGIPKLRCATRLMIFALSGSMAFVGGGSDCIENGLLGIPSISRRTQAVYLVEAGEVFEGVLAGVFAKLFGKALGVVAADLGGNHGADVAKDGVGGGLVLLSQILVRDDESQAC